VASFAKEIWMHQKKWSLAILDAAARIKKREDQLRRITRELQRALRMTVGFMDIYCELQEICHFCVKN
jgi:hypothetical protein